MPPLRSLPITAKPVKTERTHEENQERAYIAASRRSDRSLEARIESARRASEIHKRRTGRSLRVTEQDVVNEEMYEEEDDDLPMQYRRLTAHLNTNSSDFNRRLAAYLSNHVAMRSALDQAISSSYNQQQNPQYPSHLPASASTPFRSSPYPAPGAPGYRPSLKSQVADSLAQGAKFINSQSKQQQSPVDGQASSSAIKQSPVSTPPSDNNNFTAQPPSLRHSDSSASSNMTTDNTNSRHQSIFQSSNNQNWALPPQMDMSCSPLTTQLPPDAQTSFGACFGNTDSYGQNIFSNDKSQPFFSYGQFNGTHPYINGMNQTLAPDALEGNDSTTWSNPIHSSDDFFPSNYPFGMDQDFNHDSFGKPSPNMDSNQLSGQLTPADHEWSSFIDANSWDDNET